MSQKSVQNFARNLTLIRVYCGILISVLNDVSDLTVILLHAVVEPPKFHHFSLPFTIRYDSVYLTCSIKS